MRLSPLADCRSLADLLQARAQLHADRSAAVFLHDSGQISELTYGELWRRAWDVADSLRNQVHRKDGEHSFGDDAAPPLDGQRVLLLFSPGLEFLPAFFGAQLAGMIPVPTCDPKPNRSMPRVDSVARDCSPAAILTTETTLREIDRKKLDSSARSLPLIAVDSCSDHSSSRTTERAHSLTPDSTAFLQYTSGSTSAPKGVIVSQRNVMANLAAIIKSFRLDADTSSSSAATTAASWLPFFHDMGLIGGMLAPIYLGYRSVFISPQAFIRQPIRWLRMIDDYQAIASGAPNFAYDLCADRIAPSQVDAVDLSHWKVAFCGAEPIRAQSLRTFSHRFSSIGFRESSFYPCYGLAEATLIATGGDGPAVPSVLEVDRAALSRRKIEPTANRTKRDTAMLVSCGSAVQGTTVRIVDQDSRMVLPESTIGEIWLAGDSITKGYWNRPDENQHRFGQIQTRLTPGRSFGLASGLASKWFGRGTTGLAIDADDDGTYLRTGDLGFIRGGNLYVTGRIKDVVIVRGRNYSPQDIEGTVASIKGVTPGRVAAVSVEGPRAEGLGIVAELTRDTEDASFATTVRQIRRAVIDEHDIDPRLVLLARLGTLSVTTSGKLQRSLCRQAILEGTFKARYRWERNGGAESPPIPIPTLPEANSDRNCMVIESIVATWLGDWLIARLGIEPEEIQVDRRFDDYGLDSLAAVELSGELEDWSGIELTPANAWEHPTIAAMAELVAGELKMLHSKAKESVPKQAVGIS